MPLHWDTYTGGFIRVVAHNSLQCAPETPFEQFEFDGCVMHGYASLAFRQMN